MTTHRVSLPRFIWSLSLPPKTLALIGILGSLTFMGVVAGVARLLAGMGATTSLSDAVPWGIWIGFDFSLIALSGAGFTMAAVAHVLHLHRFEAAVRPALFAGFLGYSGVLLLLVLDLGRPDRFYNFILYWNLHSPLFEISWCVLLYTTVLILEVSPEFFTRFGWEQPRRWVLRAMPVVCILGITLSTLHQSTLGTLYVNMPHRLDPLWYTPFLPGLFFVSSIMAGLSVAILAYRIAARIHRAPESCDVIAGLGWGVWGALLIYLVFKLGVLAWEGKLPLLLAPGTVTTVWWTELTLGVLIPLVLWSAAAFYRPAWLDWAAPLLVILGVGMNRFNATMTAQTSPLPAAAYAPHLLEWLSTFGILAGVALAWYLAVRFVVRFHPA
jgi:Ni/Fe-hydrogenase subunit HybB-like protein